MLLTDRCSFDFPPDIRSWGETLCHQGRVQISQERPRRVEAVVRDFSGQTCQTIVTLGDAELKPHTLQVVCTCRNFARGRLCTHVWATCLQVDRLRLDKLFPGQISLSIELMPIESASAILDEQRIKTEAEHLAWVVNQPAQHHTVPTTIDWRVRFEAVKRLAARTTTDEAPASLAAKATREVWYLINLDASRERGRFVLDFFYREIGKRGPVGRLKPLRYREEELDLIADPTDRDLLAMLAGNETAHEYSFGRNRYDRVHRCVVSPRVCDALIPKLCATGRLGPRVAVGNRVHEVPKPLAYGGEEPFKFELSVLPAAGEQAWEVTGRLRQGEVHRNLDDALLLLGEGWIVFPDAVYHLDARREFPWITLLRRVGPMKVPFQQKDQLLDTLWQMPCLPPVDLPQDLAWEQIRVEPAAKVAFASPDHGNSSVLAARVTFRYGEQELQHGGLEAALVDRAGGKVYLRDRRLEDARIAELLEQGLRPSDRHEHDGKQFVVPVRLLPKVVAGLVSKGWIVEAQGRKIRQPGEFHWSVSSDIDWFDLDAKVDFDGQRASLPTLLAALERGENFVLLDDGSHGMLPEDWISRFAPLLAMGEQQGEQIRFKNNQVAVLDALLAEQPNVDIDQLFADARERLKAFRGIAAKSAPQSFIGELRGYQQEGLGWLSFLSEFGFGGCLADDMGLGKTIQVLALLEGRRQTHADHEIANGAAIDAAGGNGSAAATESHADREAHAAGELQAAADHEATAVESGSLALNGQPKTKAKGKSKRTAASGGRRPSLVVVPRSLVHNWIEEAKRFTPNMRVLDYTGIHREPLREQLAEHDLIVTTYGTLRRDIALLRKHSFDYCILDEAQAIKNSGSLAAKASRLVQADHRLAMTGTPVENHLGELWSIFEFLNPGMFGRSSAMRSVATSGRPNDPAALEWVAKALRPFMLRRTKTEVLAELPDKTEQTLYCELGKKQRQLYEELRDHYRLALQKRIEQVGLKQSKIQVLEALLRLRQAACHPALLDRGQTETSSAKLDTLLEQLREVLAENHKALVFSQFTSFLSHVRTRFDEEGWTYEYLDGRTRNRQEKVERFQNDPDCRLFVISLKAGGLGLNLTAADYVFILDPWWNPAVEAQAVDRAHRIGQTRRVFAYRLIARDTVEEKILELQKEKRQLADAVVSGDQRMLGNLTAEDLQLLLS